MTRFGFMLLGAASAFSIASANAADMYSGESLKDTPIAVIATDWSGFYIGANAGYGWSDGNGSLQVFDPAGQRYPAGSLDYDLEADGFFGGAQIGLNRQYGSIVVGIEADIQASDINGSETKSFDPPAIANFDYTAETDIEWFGTVRARLGYAIGDTLLYVTGGVAFAEINYDADYTFTDPGCCIGSFGRVKGSSTETGYVLGAGLERALGQSWSLKLEYQYLNFGDTDADGELFFASGRSSGETVETDFDTELHTVRIGVNYRFPSRAEEPLK